MNSGTHNLYLRLQTCGRFACKSARERRIVATEMVRGVVERLSLMFAVAKAPYHGIVFDAGSSGSRIHVYTWQTGGGGPKDLWRPESFSALMKLVSERRKVQWVAKG